MKVIKLFIVSMLLLSSFQTFAAFLITTPDVVSTPENRDKLITLITDFGAKVNSRFFHLGFVILPSEDADKFTLKKGSSSGTYELTFKATAFKARDNAYRVKVRAIWTNKAVHTVSTSEKTLTVNVTKTDLNDGELHITTANPLT
jgi:hypothetical protein